MLLPEEWFICCGILDEFRESRAPLGWQCDHWPQDECPHSLSCWLDTDFFRFGLFQHVRFHLAQQFSSHNRRFKLWKPLLSPGFSRMSHFLGSSCCRSSSAQRLLVKKRRCHPQKEQVWRTHQYSRCSTGLCGQWLSTLSCHFTNLQKWKTWLFWRHECCSGCRLNEKRRSHLCFYFKMKEVDKTNYFKPSNEQLFRAVKTVASWRNQ